MRDMKIKKNTFTLLRLNLQNGAENNIVDQSSAQENNKII